MQSIYKYQISTHNDAEYLHCERNKGTKNNFFSLFLYVVKVIIRKAANIYKLS